MKLNNILLWSAAASALILASCQDETGDALKATQNPTTLRASIAGWGAQTRAQVMLGNQDASEEIFMWNAGDGFDLIDLDADNANVRYEISGYSDNNPSETAEFVGKGALTEGHKVLAVYPALPASGIADGKVAFEINPSAEAAGNTNEEIVAAMSRNMVMVASTSVGGEAPSLQFRHLCAMARVTLTNTTAESMTVSAVSLSAPDAFGVKGEYDIALGNMTTVENAASLTTNFSGLSIEPGNTSNFYFLFFPGSNALAQDGSFDITVNDQTLSIPLSEFAEKGISRFEAGNRYWFQLLQSNEGLIRKANVEEGVIYNTKLIAAVEADRGITFEKDANGYVNVETNQQLIDEISYLNLSEKNLDDAAGLEYFTNLRQLCISCNPIVDLNLTKNTNLLNLECGGGYEYESTLKSLKAPASLTEIKIMDRYDWDRESEPALNSVDLALCTNLEYIRIYNSNLTEVSLPECPNLESIDIYGSKIIGLDLSKTPNLRTLRVNNNAITALEVSACPNLEVLECGNNKITSIDLSSNLALTELNLSGNGYSSDKPSNLISELDLSHNVNLVRLACANLPNMHTLDVSANVNLEEFTYGWHYIEWVDISNNKKLRYLDFGGVTIDEPDFSTNPALERIQCNGADIKKLDVSMLEELKFLDCANTPITSLDLSKNVKLNQLWCYACHLTELDLTNNSMLTDWQCGDQHTYPGWEDIELTLYLTADQMTIWTESLEHSSGNNHVNAMLKE